MTHPSKKIMQMAIEEAKKAAEQGQYALAAVIVKNDEVVSIAHTTLHKVFDPSAHAEMNAVRDAAQKLNSKYLEGAWLYTTQEPCPMCTSVAIWAKMEGIVFGAFEQDAIDAANKKNDPNFSWRQIHIPSSYVIERGEPKLQLIEGFMREECIKLYALND